MIVTLQRTKNPEEFFVIDEIARFLGTVNIIEFLDCIYPDKEPFEADESLWYCIDKRMLNSIIK